LISTEIGYLRMDELYTIQDRPLVHSYNHKTGRIELRKVVAARSRYANDLHEFQTESGNTLRCTGRHRLFAGGSVYRQAKDFRQGEPLFSRVPSVRRQERAARPDLLQVLCWDT